MMSLRHFNTATFTIEIFAIFYYFPIDCSVHESMFLRPKIKYIKVTDNEGKVIIQKVTYDNQLASPLTESPKARRRIGSDVTMNIIKCRNIGSNNSNCKNSPSKEDVSTSVSEHSPDKKEALREKVSCKIVKATKLDRILFISSDKDTILDFFLSITWCNICLLESRNC